MMKKTDPWIPYCIYCSPSSGDLLVGMYRFDTKIGKVTRHNGVGQHIQTIQYSKTSQGLYSRPNYITENRNGDVIVSNIIGIFHGDVVVTDHRGTYRFSYTGPPSGSELCPYGICTDALSHILVCDYNTDTIQLIDKDGQFLTLILTELQGIHRPGSLSYDDKTHALWVGSLNSKKMRVYRYIERQNYPTCCSN
ncbi:uncharacterized protein LOC133195516 [Saccostrea echinata]|uniref:uncharacterized protein LOC133195516 n=1 Tax=Saccostrea echinata TaxID=191078 RepID=UPI002A82DCB7|nr:uncharacterized protein LOC133195516 [Saccostrea echinata]